MIEKLLYLLKDVKRIVKCDVNFIVKEKKIIVRNWFYFDIYILLKKEDTIVIRKIWKLGFFGGLLFKNRMLEMDVFCDEVERKLTSIGLKVSFLNINN